MRNGSRLGGYIFVFVVILERKLIKMLDMDKDIVSLCSRIDREPYVSRSSVYRVYKGVPRFSRCCYESQRTRHLIKIAMKRAC